MKNLYNFNNIAIEDYSDKIPDEFLDKLEQKCSELTYHKICIQPNGLAILINLNDNQISFLGCPLCLDTKIEQNEGGSPTINGNKLISIVEMKDAPKNMSAFVSANLWLCPNCFTPNTSLFPEFI